MVIYNTEGALTEKFLDFLDPLVKLYDALTKDSASDTSSIASMQTAPMSQDSKPPSQSPSTAAAATISVD